ncbi:MAG: SufD family Fe-S cluster assembly protein, partial [Pseudomonadota bacterium]
DADMQHQALLLEDGAVVFAKPELEIYADDVECAHGNTSGALDPNQLFYLRQRGIPETQARALLTEAFIAEALEDASESVQEAMLDTARDFLRGAF